MVGLVDRAWAMLRSWFASTGFRVAHTGWVIVTGAPIRLSKFMAFPILLIPHPPTEKDFGNICRSSVYETGPEDQDPHDNTAWFSCPGEIWPEKEVRQKSHI